MKSFLIRRGVLRSLVLMFALGAMSVSVGAMAASRTAGGIYGEAPAGSTVTVSNRAGLTRTVTVGNDGHFSFVSLPPGEYTVQEMQNGNVIATRSAVVTINTSTHVAFGGAAQQLGTIQVVGGAINPIDVTTSNTSLVLNSSQFTKLPVPRNTDQVVLLAPTTLSSSPLLGDNIPPSFGGASAAENAFFLNGLNITDNLNFVTYARPPFEGLELFQVKTGGLNAAYGAALGGVLNMVTKSGTNEFHAGANIFWVPSGLRAPQPNSVVRKVGDSSVLQYYQRYSEDTHNSFRYNIYGSGPIIEDHLFFYALYQGQDEHNQYYTDSIYEDETLDSPQYLAKVDWQINDANLLELTAFSSQNDADRVVHPLMVPNSKWPNKAVGGPYVHEQGSNAYIGKYTLTPTSNFTISGMFGYVTWDHAEHSPTQLTCPTAYDQRSGAAVRIGCWANAGFSGNDDYDARHQVRIDGEWQLGPHDITFGYDREIFFGNVTSSYSGGIPPNGPYLTNDIHPNGIPGYRLWYYSAQLDPDLGVCVDATSSFVVPGCQDYVARRIFVDDVHFKSYKRAYYLQDNWRIGNFYLRYGARVLSYRNDNPKGIAFIDINNTIAPRLGLSWDVFGDSSLKVYANAGRYYIPVSGDQNTRLAGREIDYYEFYTVDGFDPATGQPINPVPFPGDYVNSDGEIVSSGSNRYILNGSAGKLPDAKGVVAQNIEPMYEDEYILGAQQRLEGTQWSFGIRMIHRDLKSAIDDVCTFPYPSFGAVQYIAEQSGVPAADVSAALPGCFLLNPGSDAEINVTLNGENKTYTVPADAIGVPKATRYYNAVELLFERAFDGKWFLNGSLTWSHNYGNEEGYLLSDIGQVDAGLTEAFDFPGIMDGAYGNLPNDRRWVLKLFGAYSFTPEWQVGFNFHYQSGAPLSCFGVGRAAATGRPFVHFYGNDSHYCGDTAFATPRGSVGRSDRVYYLNGSIHYMPNWAPGLRFGVSVVNLLNFQHAELLSQTYESDSGTRLTSYLAPYSFQTPRYFRFSIEYDFL